MKIPIGIQPEKQPDACEDAAIKGTEQKSSGFSSLAARVFFFLLFMGDVLWFCYALILFIFATIGSLLTLSKIQLFVELRSNAILTLKRSLVCGISLMVALFSPAFGIMIACTYFLMYDRGGIEEVVPSSLQNQFKDFLNTNSDK